MPTIEFNILYFSVFCYNFELRDHGEPTLKNLLDMIKVMAFAVSEGKVAVHCHAGELLNLPYHLAHSANNDALRCVTGQGGRALPHG